MKKIAALILVMMVALSACAPVTGTDTTRVKCPACGYEFDLNESPGN